DCPAQRASGTPPFCHDTPSTRGPPYSRNTRVLVPPASTNTRNESALLLFASWAKYQRNVSEPTVDGSWIGWDRIVGGPPSGAFALAVDPAARPVANAFEPECGCGGWIRTPPVNVGSGAPRAHAPRTAGAGPLRVDGPPRPGAES